MEEIQNARGIADVLKEVLSALVPHNSEVISYVGSLWMIVKISSEIGPVWVEWWEEK